MTLALMEAAIAAVYTYLSTNMAAKLDALDTEYADWVLADIKAWYRAEVTAVPEFPSCFILSESTDVKTEGAGWLNSAHTITIAYLVSDADTEKLRKRLYRYARATMELLIEGRATMGYEIVFTRVDFSPMFSRAGEFLSDARLVVSLSKTEVK